MAKFDDFDLDVNVNKERGVKPEIWSSFALCTPGTCYDGCKGSTTYNSNCCNIASQYLCSAGC
jgi:hypothetical protein